MEVSKWNKEEVLYILVIHHDPNSHVDFPISCKIQSVNKTGFGSVIRFTEKTKKIYWWGSSHTALAWRSGFTSKLLPVGVCRCWPILFVQDVCTHFNVSEQTTMSFIVPEERNLHVHTNLSPAERRPRMGVTCGHAFRCDSLHSRFCAGCWSSAELVNIVFVWWDSLHLSQYLTFSLNRSCCLQRGGIKKNA